MNDLVGTTLANYRILDELGRGGMAVVYLAEDMTMPGRKVAIKVLFPEAAQRLDILQRFRREAALYDKLKHPRIIHSYGLEETDGFYYLVLDYMEGGSLAQRIKLEGRIPWDETVRITRQVAEALAFAHDQGIVHRDVKPSNILFDAFGDAYLADFGIAHDAEAVTITQVGVQPGTYHYMAPEQIQGKKVDHRADQFSLATVVFQMICGYLPFSASDTFALSYQIVNEPPALLPEDLEAPPGIATVLGRAHEKDPNARYPDIMAFANALERLSFDEPVSVSPPLIPKTKPHQPPRSWGSLLVKAGKWGMAAAIVLGLLFTGFHYLPSIFASQKPKRRIVTIMPPTSQVQISDNAQSNSGKATVGPGGILVINGASTPTPTFTPTASIKKDVKAPTPTLILFTPTPNRNRSHANNPKKPKGSDDKSPSKVLHTDGHVVLLEPSPNQTLLGRVTFAWAPDFKPAENEAFELAFWRPTQDPESDARSPVRASQATRQTVDMRGVQFIKQGPEWFWGVFLFDRSTNRRIKLLSEPRRFYYHGD